MTSVAASDGGDNPTADERTLAMLAELLQLFSWIIGPAIIFLVKRDSKFVRFHALQAMLWQAFIIVLYVVCFAAFIPIMIFTTKQQSPNSNQSAFPVLLMVGFWIAFALIALANMVLAIYFGVKANGGHWSRYPILGRIAWRFVRS